MANERVALYARVSTLLGQSPEMQLVELREYAARRGWHVIGEYVDRASGIKESRPALNRLMTDARRRKFDMIAVWKIDRFGRSLKHLVNALAELEAVGVAFVSLRDNLDLSTPAGRLMFQIIAAMAEFERALIQERVRRPAERKAKGQAARATPRCCGRGPDTLASRRRRFLAHDLPSAWGRCRHALQGSSAAFRKPLTGAVGKWLIPDSWVSRKNSSTNTLF